MVCTCIVNTGPQELQEVLHRRGCKLGVDEPGCNRAMLFLERSRCVTLLKNAIRYEISVIKFRDRSTLIKGPPWSNSAGTCPI